MKKLDPDVLNGGVLRYLRLVASLAAHAEGAEGASGTLSVAQLTRRVHAVILFPSTLGENAREVDAILLSSNFTIIAQRTITLKVTSPFYYQRWYTYTYVPTLV